MIFSTRTFLSAAAIASIFAPSVASAQKLEATYGDWKTLTHKQGSEKLCYAATIPTKKTGNYTKRGEPFVLVTRRSGGVDEVSVSSGYPYKKGVSTQLTIDGKKFKLFVEGERAWGYDLAQDKEMVVAMRKGSKMTIKGTSKKGTYSLDTYSLKGSSKAITATAKLCK